MKDYPVFELGTHKYWHDEQCYVDGDSAWLNTTLWAEAKTLPTYELPLIGFATNFALWDDMSFTEFCAHCRLVNESDLKYPIILTPEGNIADGRHRLAKAIINGHRTIKTKRLVQMPDPDFVFDEDGNTLYDEEDI